MAEHHRSAPDITDIRPGKEMLLTQLIDKNLDAVILTNSEGTISAWNRAAMKVFEWSEAEIIGEKITKVFSPESLLHIKNIMSSEEDASAIEIYGRTKGESEIPVLVSAGVVAEHQPNALSYLYIVRDQRGVLEQNESIREKIQALESFTYSVSHDLRAPLRRIVNYAEILQEDHYASLNEEVQRIVMRMAKNTQKMSELIDDLLAYSRLSQQDFHKSLVDVNVLVRSVVEEHKQSSKTDHINFILRHLDPIYADRNLLKVVFSQLIANAIKFSRDKTNPIIEIRSEEDPSFVTYSVIDNGVGFDMQYAHKLFGVFQRLHNPNAFEGNGMGLAIVNQIVTRHQGKVSAHSEIGHGATISFSLPKVAPKN